MVIRRSGDNAIEFARVESLESELLSQIPVLGETGGDARAEDRLFSSPAEPSEEQFLRDWAEYVQPELRYLFQSSRQTVATDLEKSWEKSGRFGRLVIPLDHAEAWLNALNQARLVLATRFDFTDEELSFHTIPRSLSKRDLILVQINFYAAVQERIIDILEGGREEEG
jgi:Domain of unknown function (DUF2017)